MTTYDEELWRQSDLDATKVRSTATGRSLVIQPKNWPDESSSVVAACDCQERSLDKLCEMLGVPSVGRP
jgi:hypothetical protein